MKNYIKFSWIYLLYMFCFFILLSIARNIILSVICNVFEVKGKSFAIIYVVLDCILLALSYFLSTLAAIKHGIKKRKQLDKKKFILFIAIFFVAISLLNILINILFYNFNLDVILNNTDIYIRIISGKAKTIEDIKVIYKTLSIIKCIITSISVLPMILIVRTNVLKTK